MPKEKDPKKIKKQMKQCMKDMDALAKDTNKQIMKEIKKLFNTLRKDVIGDSWHLTSDTWYGSYIPDRYHRRFSYFNVPYIEPDYDNVDYGWGFDPDRIKQWHRVQDRLGDSKGKEYLYDLAFEHGWHGGARSGPPDYAGQQHPPINRPNTGTPYYRRPPKEPNRYRFWGQKAAQTFAIRPKYEQDFEEKKKPIIEYHQKEFLKKGAIIIKEFKRLKAELNKIS